MTALMPEQATTEAVDLDAIRVGIVALLAEHGLTGHDNVNIDVRPLSYEGVAPGVTITASVWTQPATFVAATREQVFDRLVEQALSEMEVAA